ncbi:anti-sigma factor [Pseudomonas sp. B21_DOA]|nr:anti-sigma factor [Pseudomonas sp. B21_DOA]
MGAAPAGADRSGRTSATVGAAMASHRTQSRTADGEETADLVVEPAAAVARFECGRAGGDVDPRHHAADADCAETELSGGAGSAAGQGPGWVIQASNAREIQLIPLGVVEVPADKALEFWTKADGWSAPVSLGLVKPGQALSVPLDKLPPLQPNQLFELTLEGANGSPIGKPTGPIQAIGRAVKVL